MTAFTGGSDISDLIRDSDGDGIDDRTENNDCPSALCVVKTDSDNDGLPDNVENTRAEYDPFNPDTDGNGIRDGDEALDGDGLTNIEELFVLDQFNPRLDPAETTSDSDNLSKE